MDPFIATFAAQPDGDLMVCESNGVAYQADMTPVVEYGEAYWRKVSAYEDSAIAESVNLGRCELLTRYLTHCASVLDIGAGTGAFIRAAMPFGFYVRGFEVMPRAVMHLKVAGLYETAVENFDAVTMWDVLEHMVTPGDWLRRVRSWLFVSLPVFKSLSNIRASRHYRPGEHLYYFTPDGLVDWLRLYGFKLIARSNHEIEAGRDSIGAFAFRRTH